MAMESNIFVINPGSSSRKYALYYGEESQAYLHFEREGEGFVATGLLRGETIKEAINQDDYDASLAYAQKMLKEGGLSLKDIDLVGVRVVAPGTFFQAHRVIDEVYEENLRKVGAWASLHVAPLLQELSAVRKLLPKSRLVGVSDSAFHSSLPDKARHYALPYRDAEKFDIFRFGYHGISVRSVVRKYGQDHGDLPTKTIVCHLGGGSSITALRDGVSVETSMGFTPLEGVPMTTRIGDLDVGALLYLMRQSDMDYEAATEYLTTKSGLLGVSGTTGDVRELLKHEADDGRAKLALKMYVDKIQQYIGAYVTVLGGVDLLILTATISERSVVIRQRIVGGLEGLGIVVDRQRNDMLGEEGGFIESENSAARVAVVPSDEMGEIMYEAKKESSTI